MSSAQSDEKKEEESVSVFVRPLEVTVAADFTSSSEVHIQSSSNVKPNVPPPPPPPKAANTVWSTMTSVIESETSVKRWSTPLVKKEEGTPPGPEDHPQTKEGQSREGNVIGITPNYKIGEGKPKSELTLGKTGYLPNEKGDYKVSMRHEDYKQTIIDPKVQSNARMPYSSSTLPEAKRQLADDFPSSHSKRSLIKLEPLEQRRFKSVESRPITTSNYLTESVERHRDMEASRLREYLKARESDANKPWNKPGWPGPKPKNDDESMRELEHIRKSIETLQKKVRATSMQDLHLLSPAEFEKQNPSPQVSPAPPRDNGWLIKMRTNRYLDSTKDTNSLKRHKSVDVLSSKGSGLSLPRDLLDVDSQRPKNADPLHWQLRKEFHLTKYSERRASWSQDVLQPSSSTSSINRPRHDPPPPPPPPPPIIEDVQNHPSTNTSPLPPPPPVTTNLHKPRSRSQLLYPPGSTENIASEHRAAERPPERIVYENHPFPPSSHGLGSKYNDRYQQAARNPEEDYPERLMSPPPGHQPRSILKQQHQQQYEYSSSQHHQQYSQQKSEYREEYQQHQSNGNVRNNPQPSSSAQPAVTSGAPSSVPTSEYNMRPHTTSFQDLPEEERYRIMQENLQKHRQQKPHSHQNKQPVASFNGPFFRIEEVDGGAGHPHPNHEPQRQQHLSHYEYDHHEVQQHSSQLEQMKQMSASEIELDTHYSRQDDRGPAVVVWPPISDQHKQRPRSQSVMSRNIADPDRIDELRRQKALERDAMRRREEERMISMQKQLMAMQIQQQRLYEQQHGVTSPVPMMDETDYHNSQAPPKQHNAPNGPTPSHQHQPQLYSPTPPLQTNPQQLYTDPGPPGPQNVRVFETRPISSMSDMIDPQMTSPNQQTWKRTYLVEKPHDVAKNEILTSGELLEKEQYEVDILKRREAFVEKHEDSPEIHRTGKRWQPPLEKPYVWPTLRRPISVEPGAMMEPIDFGPGVPAEMDDGEYKWAPVINDPGYRHEHKNFTPTSSPPLSPRRGGGTGPLDEPAKRQTKYVIQPSADGSHRPKPAFRKERQPPSGGFYPHAPNAIKIVKRRAQSVQGLTSPVNQSHEDVEIIHQRNYHRIDPIPDYQPERSVSTTEGRLKRAHHSQTDLRHLNDWEKIYELPPHSSTLVEKGVPRNVDVRRRLNQFEGAIQSGRQSVARANSVDSSHSLPYPPPDYDQTLPVPQSRRSHSQHHLHSQQQHQQQQQHQHRQDHNLSRQQVSRRNSVASTRLDTPTGHMSSGQRQHSSRQEHNSSRQSRHSLSQSRAASTLALSPTPHGDNPNAQRARTMIARATAPSPTPLSYERARAYVPPPLPTGYRLTDPSPDMRALSPQQGNTKRMIRTVAEAAQRAQSTQNLHLTPQQSRAPSRTQSVRDPRLLSPNPRFL